MDAGFLCNKSAVVCVKIKERPCTMLTLQYTAITVAGTRQLASCIRQTRLLLGPLQNGHAALLTCLVFISINQVEITFRT